MSAGHLLCTLVGSGSQGATPEKGIPVKIQNAPLRWKVAASIFAIPLILSACAKSTDDNDKTDLPAGEVTDGDIAFVENYTGYGPGEIDSNKEPITIGFTSQQGGQLQFPDSAVGFNAAVTYLNEEFGGIDGHEIVLKECFIQTEEDGQKCATEFVNDDDIDIIVKGVAVNGAESFVSTVGGKLPIYSPSFVVATDSTGKDVYTAQPGTLRLIAQADVIAKEFPKAKQIALIYQDNPAGKGGYQVLVDRLEALGDYAMKAVPVPDTATATDITSALQSSGAVDADVLLPIATTPLCIAIADGMKTLSVEADVVASANCYADAVFDKYDGSLPEGWYFIDNGVNPYVVDEESGTHLFEVLMNATDEGQDLAHSMLALDSFGSAFHIAKLVHEIGPDELTADEFRNALSSYDGEVVGRAGNFNCGGTEAFPALCMNSVGLSQWIDGTMKSIASAQNGKAIEVKF